MHRCLLRVRHHIKIIQPLAERGVGGELGVADAEVGVGGVVAQPVLARAALNFGDAFAAEPLVGKEGQRSRVPVGNP